MIQATSICVESVFFAFGHWIAFTWKDFDDSRLSSRMELWYAFRDCLGNLDIRQDIYHTFKGTKFHHSPVSNTDLLERMDEEEAHDAFVFTNERRYHSVTALDVDEDEISLEFDELDASTELLYEKSRLLVYGDGHFPVIHEDPRFVNPPEVQQEIERRAEQVRIKFGLET